MPRGPQKRRRSRLGTGGRGRGAPAAGSRCRGRGTSGRSRERLGDRHRGKRSGRGIRGDLCFAIFFSHIRSPSTTYSISSRRGPQEQRPRLLQPANLWDVQVDAADPFLERYALPSRGVHIHSPFVGALGRLGSPVLRPFAIPSNRSAAAPIGLIFFVFLVVYAAATCCEAV